MAVLNEDRILRRYLDLIKATLRTNFYQNDNEGDARDYLSLKFDPTQIPELPLPRPMFEIFVYSPRVEGVHCAVARWPAAGCAGPTAKRITAPRCWGWSRPSR
ncbi:NAD-glutamate dehydrogenase [Halopseudomonas pachastrellae]|nr:NAD-glutamate dehydrogenase [Halopseudomonas pachastrellae]